MNGNWVLDYNNSMCQMATVKTNILYTTYAGNLCVMCEHHEIKPNVIKNADINVIANDMMPKKTSRKRPRNAGSSLLIVNRDSLQ